MKNVLIAIMFFSNTILCQIIDENIRDCHPQIRGFSYNYKLFFPLNDVSERLDSDTSYQWKKLRIIYCIDGLCIADTMKIISDLKNITKEEGFYEYCCNDITKQVEMVKLHLKVNVPVVLNGIEIEKDKIKYFMERIDINQIISIKIKSRLLFWKYLEIVTE